jgi:hypothetical protein
VELLKSSGETGSLAVKLYNKAAQNRNIQDKWKMACITTIYKK